tara:strand:+ start:2528 stop:2665 length:138 start_codon:yes stop_codon:yes gene_type:complete
MKNKKNLENVVYLSSMLGTIAIFYFLGARKFGAPKIKDIGKRDRL